MWQSLVAGALSGKDSAALQNPALQDYSGGIVVSPVACNLGEILKIFGEGGPETGGYGIDVGSRLGSNTRNSPTSKYNEGDTLAKVLLNPLTIGAAVFVGLLLILGR